MKYSKFIVAVIVAVAGGISAALSGDGHIDPSEMVNIAILGIGALSVYFAPNAVGTTGTALYSKAIIAALTAGLTALQSYITGGVSPTEWIQIVFAALGPLGVFFAPSSNP